MPFRILKIKFPKGAWRKPLFYFRGHEKVSEQCLLTAAVQNMKKIATRLSLLFSYYISNFNDIMYFKLYPQLVNKNPLFFKQGVFQQTVK